MEEVVNFTNAQTQKKAEQLNETLGNRLAENNVDMLG